MRDTKACLPSAPRKAVWAGGLYAGKSAGVTRIFALFWAQSVARPSRKGGRFRWLAGGPEGPWRSEHYSRNGASVLWTVIETVFIVLMGNYSG